MRDEQFFVARESGRTAKLGSGINRGNWPLGMVLISAADGLMGQMLGACNNYIYGQTNINVVADLEIYKCTCAYCPKIYKERAAAAGTRDWNIHTETERLGPFRSTFGVADDVAVSSASE